MQTCHAPGLAPVVRYRHTDTLSKETFFYHPSGLVGPACGGRGGPIVRTRDTNLAATPTDWATAGVSDWDGERYFYCTDLSGNMIAMVDDLVEQCRYSPSGVPYGLPAGDLNGDGHVEDGAGKPDYGIWLAATTAYQVRADLNFDGTVNAADQAIITSNSTVNLGRGKFSAESVRNIKGYQGCEVFGEGLHRVWGCTSRLRDAGLSFGGDRPEITDPSTDLPFPTLERFHFTPSAVRRV